MGKPLGMCTKIATNAIYNQHKRDDDLMRRYGILSSAIAENTFLNTFDKF